MQTMDVERRRHQMARGYEIVRAAQLRVLGYLPPEQHPSRLERLRRKLEFQFLRYYAGGVPHWRLALRQYGGRRTLPDFCVIGPIKSGTSDLATSLLLHPNVMAPLTKELPAHALDPESWRLFYPTEAEKRQHAARHGVALSPYLSPYLHFLELAHQVARHLPNAKVVIPLRDPAERFYSHWKWEVFMSGRQRALQLPFLATFPAYVDKALEAFPDCTMYTRVGAQPLQTSIYWQSVREWISAMGEQNVLVLDISEYFRERAGFMRKIHDFVGLPAVTMPALTGVINENPLRLPPADPHSMAKLREFFRPRNDKLWEVIGKRFDW
jgi:hypothetical protein